MQLYSGNGINCIGGMRDIIDGCIGMRLVSTFNVD